MCGKRSHSWAPGLRSVVLSAVVVACVPGERPPEVPIRGTIAPGAEAKQGRAAGPFAVVFAGPHGKAGVAAEISLVFSEPLRPLGPPEASPLPPVSIAPPVAGAWHWVGTRALTFAPAAGRLPGATHFTVEVSGTTRSAAGKTLGAPYRLELETPRPEIVRTVPPASEQAIELDTVFTVELSQAIAPAAVERGVRLLAEAGRAPRSLPFSVQVVDPKAPKKILLRPRAPLPRDSAIRVEVMDGLVGQEGPLPAKPASLAYRTYGPLTVKRVDCDTSTAHGRCAPGSSIGITLSNPVKLSALRRAVSVTPAVPLTVFGDDPDELTHYFEVTSRLSAGASYSIRVDGALTDKYGQRLGATFERSIAIDDFLPRAEIGISGDTLLAGTAAEIPLGSINLPRYDVLTAALAPGDVTALLALPDDGARAALLGRLPQTRTRKVTPVVEKNHTARDAVGIRDVVGKEHGVLGIAVRFAKDSGDYRQDTATRLIKVTDLAISAKVSRHGTLVWVTRLGTGAPVAKATVEVLGKDTAGKRRETDADGFARIAPEDFVPDFERDAGQEALIIARSGDDWTYERVSDHVPEWRIPVPMDLSSEEHDYGMLFTERGVYRPGDAVRVKGILRRAVATGNETKAGRKYDLELRSPEDEVVAKVPVTTSRYGTFAATVSVPHSASLGSFQLRATSKDGDVAWDGFEVAEYRPSELKVEVERGAPSYLHGDSAHFTVRGDYLFGAPMGGQALRYSVSRSTSFYEVPDHGDFVTDANAYFADRDEAPLSYAELSSRGVNLDAGGSFTVSQKLDLPGQRGPETVRIDAEVTDVSRQATSASATVLVHPADFYVGLLAPEDSFVSAPSDLEPKVVAAAIDGARLAGKKVHLELVERRFTLAREALPGGGSHAVSRVVDQVKGGCDVVTAAAPVSCKLRVDASGYHVIVARSKDGRGNPVQAAIGLYAMGKGKGFSSFGDNDRAIVDLVPNKKQYRVGETARVLVKMPFAEAQAWVTVERAGIHHTERMLLRGPTPTVSVPITDDLRPNAFVAVHLLRSAKGKVPGPLYRVGYADLLVDPESRRLTVDVKPSKRDLRPGDEVTIEMAVSSRDRAKLPAELTVYAVDEGALMLTGYRTPDPVPVFTAPRPLSVATVESRESLARVSLESLDGAFGLEKGQDGGGGGDAGARRDFRQTAFYDPSVVTDGSGHATVRFRLPESLTTYRVMAIATSEGDQYGFGSASITTSRRLLARPALPRFLTAGDRALAGVIVTSKGLPASRARVRLRATGLVVDGPAERVVDLPKDASVEVRFPLRADQVGTAKLELEVTAGGERDAVEVTRAVRAPGRLETVALRGSTEGASAEGIGDLSAIRHDTGSLEIVLAPSALVGLDGAAVQLTEYPYACTEQLSSRLLPLLPLGDLARAFGFAMPKDSEAVVGRTLGQILSRQKGDGGFGMWSESPSSQPWISAYATFVLDRAVASGVAVPKSARDHAHGYLRRYLAARDASRESLSTAAFMVDVLAEAGLPDAGYMTRLFEKREDLPLFAQAYLLHALALGKGPAAAVDELKKRVEGQLRITSGAAFAIENEGDAYAVLLDSAPRTTALVLRALLAVAPKHALGEPLARGLLEARRGSAWKSTQETAYALLALDAYRRAREIRKADFTARIWLEGALVRSTRFGQELRADRSVLGLGSVPRRGEGKLVFDKAGTGTLFYEARLRYVRRELPVEPLDEGFFLQRSSRVVRPEELSGTLSEVRADGTTRFAAGDLVLTDLVVVTPTPRDFVVVDDPLPAGFEAIDTTLATTASWLSIDENPGTEGEGDADCDGCDSSRDALAHGHAFLRSLTRKEARDDRVVFFADHLAAGMYHYRHLARATTAGTFVAPVARVEEMYHPEVHGRTSATTVVVE